MKNKSEIIKSLSNGIAGILAVSTNEWTSVRVVSLTGVLKENEVSSKYLPYITHELKKIGLLFVEGERGGMRYKIDSAVTYDAMSIAKKVYDDFYSNTQQLHGYPEAFVGDLTPKQNGKKHTVNDLEKSSKVENHMRKVVLPCIGEKRLLLRDNEIVEAKIRGIRLVNDEDASSMKIYNIRWHHAGDFFYTEEVNITELFETVEDLLRTLSKKHRKYPEFVKDKNIEKSYPVQNQEKCIIVIDNEKWSVNCDFLESILHYPEEERNDYLLRQRDTLKIESKKA